jgi:unconventional prefoldin RPB5 interactor 1
MEAGVYQAADPGSLQKLQKEHNDCILDSKSRAKVWAKHKEDYTALKQRLATITDKTYYNIMVPFGGKKAFFEGQMVHTNEIMVLLGDNWFVERSAKEAGEICQRRIDRCDEMLDKIDAEIKLYESWQRETKQLGFDADRGEGNLEIREPFEEEAEKKWRLEHRERLKKYKKEDNVTTSPPPPVPTENENEDLWRRLDELEIEEELDVHLASNVVEKEDDDDEDEEEDWSDSPSITDDEEEPEDDPSPRRAVSFGDVKERLFSREQDNAAKGEAVQESGTKIIEFDVSKVIPPTTTPQKCTPGSVPNNPGDLIQLFGHNLVVKPQEGLVKVQTPKRSILKTSKYPISNESVEQNNYATTSAVEPKALMEPQVKAVSDVVVERQSLEASNSMESAPVTQKMSRFRATRVKKQ